MKRNRWIVLTLAALLIGPPLMAGSVTAEGVFAQLASLEGTWQGTPEGKGEEAEAEAELAGMVTHDIEVSAAGTVVMERMGPGTDHEMINMYHLDGEDLLLTHYCAGGNQPRMKLNLDDSTAEKLIFDFVGGTNLDPVADHYIRSAELRLLDENHLESTWQSWGDGKPQATMIFHLARAD
jgi:hypothetical protein